MDGDPLRAEAPLVRACAWGEDEKPRITTKAERAVDRAEVAYGKAVAALEQAHQSVLAARTMSNWIDRFPERSKGASTPALDLPSMNGAGFTVPEVIAKLREVVTR